MTVRKRERYLIRSDKSCTPGSANKHFRCVRMYYIVTCVCEMCIKKTMREKILTRRMSNLTRFCSPFIIGVCRLALVYASRIFENTRQTIQKYIIVIIHIYKRPYLM